MSEPKSSRTVQIVNPEGLHVRAASLFVRVANRFQSQISVVRPPERVDGKGMLGLLTLGAYQGCDLVLEAEGADAEQAVVALSNLIAQGFHETAPAAANGAAGNGAAVPAAAHPPVAGT